jgi:hypothetical protein
VNVPPKLFFLTLFWESFHYFTDKANVYAQKNNTSRGGGLIFSAKSALKPSLIFLDINLGIDLDLHMKCMTWKKSSTPTVVRGWSGANQHTPYTFAIFFDFQTNFYFSCRRNSFET